MNSIGGMNALLVIWILGAPLVVGVIELFTTPKPDERPLPRPGAEPARAMPEPAATPRFSRSPALGLPPERL